MDDVTRQSSPEFDTGPTSPANDAANNANNPNTNVGQNNEKNANHAAIDSLENAETQNASTIANASSTEFTQVAPRRDAPRTYAIPDADPADLTVQGIPQHNAQSNTQHNAQIVSPVPLSTQPPNFVPELTQQFGQTTKASSSGNLQSESAANLSGNLNLPGTPTVPYPYSGTPVNNGVPINPPGNIPPYVQQGTSYPSPIPASRPRQNWLWVAIAIFLFSTTVAVSIGVFVFLRLSNGISDTIADVATNTANGTTTPNVTLVGGVPVTPTLVPTPTVGLQIQAWDGKRRLTILMMGIDKRPNEKGSYFRTDSLMLISIDPKTKSVGILSVPRDLFVDIPTDTVVTNPYGLQRVNAAYVIGELARPGYGPQLAMQTLQYNLGIRINNYVVYEFGTVINGINIIGGVDINVDHALRDDTYPNMYFGYDPLYIPAGLQHMNGDLALKYARTRHQSSDFDRAKRQQQVVMAARDKILNNNMLPDLITRAPQLWSQLSSTTKTDLSFDQLLRLAVYLKDVPKENIKQGLVDLNYVTGLNYNGQDILVPERAKLGPLLAQVFGPNYNS